MVFGEKDATDGLKTSPSLAMVEAGEKFVAQGLNVGPILSIAVERVVLESSLLSSTRGILGGL